MAGSTLRRACAAVVVALAASATSAALASPAVPIRTHTSSARQIIWHDEFNRAAGSAPNARLWQVQTGGGGWGNSELEAYTARRSNVQQSGHGRLRIVARHEQYTDYAGDHLSYTSARLMSYRKFKYGYLVARIRVPSGAGLWPAFWTLGADVRHNVAWPATGEIDVMESINDMTFVAGSLHGTDRAAQYPWQAYTFTHRITRSLAVAGRWHTYGVNWTANRITWYCDGKAYATVVKSEFGANDVWEFSKPHVALLNLAVGGNWPGAPDAQTVFPAVMKIDYVRLYNHR